MLSKRADSDIAAAAKLNSLQGIDLDEQIPLDEPLLRPGGTKSASTKATACHHPARDPNTLAKNPYNPSFETRAVDFVRRNGKAGGRGITLSTPSAARKTGPWSFHLVDVDVHVGEGHTDAYGHRPFRAVAVRFSAPGRGVHRARQSPSAPAGTQRQAYWKTVRAPSSYDSGRKKTNPRPTSYGCAFQGVNGS